MHDSLPTYLTLRSRGIATTNTCPMCKEEDESSSHLFLYCSFARACQHGSPSAIHTSELEVASVQQWLNNLLIRYKKLEQDMMDYLKAVFTFLQTIQNHRNLVTHEGKNPNPLEVILTAQRLFCRFKEAFSMERNQGRKSTRTNSISKSIGGHWEMIIKIS